MRIYKILFFFGLMYLAACKANKIPDGVIKPPQMASLLTEVHIIDGSLNTMTSVPDTMYKYGAGRYIMLFKKYHTDTTTFKKSFRYYTFHPDVMQTIYDQVVDNLKKKTDSLNKLQYKSKNALPPK